MKHKTVTLSIQVRVPVQALALCTRFYSEKNVFVDRKGSLVRWIVDDFCALLRRTKGWSYESTEQSIERLKAYGILEVEKSISTKRAYLEEIDVGLSLDAVTTLSGVSEDDVKAVIERLEKEGGGHEQ